MNYLQKGNFTQTRPGNRKAEGLRTVSGCLKEYEIVLTSNVVK